MLKDQKLNYRIDLIAYTLEEPPYFRTENMGSHIHAQYLKDHNIDVYGMVSVEMIGYFKDEKDSQSYPLGIFILGLWQQRRLHNLGQKIRSRRFCQSIQQSIQRIQSDKNRNFYRAKVCQRNRFSDHLNYWKFGYSALMITDTSFFRNKNYHQTTDTLETLDLVRMTRVIDGIFFSLIHMK